MKKKEIKYFNWYIFLCIIYYVYPHETSTIPSPPFLFRDATFHVKRVSPHFLLYLRALRNTERLTEYGIISILNRVYDIETV